MAVHRSVSTDKDSGKTTQIDYTEKRSDGKVETRHVDPNSGKYTGKSVSDPETGKTEHYTREQAGMGGCYLTTACVYEMGLPDDCLELQTLRHFRDNILLKTPGSRKEVEEYYRISPEIIAAVESKGVVEARRVWEALYGEIRRAVDFVKAGKYNEAFKHYKGMTLNLESQFI